MRTGKQLFRAFLSDIRPWTKVVSAVLLMAAVASHAAGYANDGPGGGPHRRLNALALSRFIQMAAQDPILKHYDFRPTVERYGLPAASGLFHVKFQTVTQSGSWYRHMSLWPGVTSSFIEEGDVSAPFAWWVEEGGYTADEPESFMAMRHFYDPLAQSLDSETGKRVSYLTDELDPWVSPILMGHNPRMDAKTWAVKESPYSFYWGQTGLLYIDGLPIVHEDRGREFGKVWRTLGESLHLLADMTVPAHVRNDSHPGPWILNYLTIKKTLKGDPYEDYVDADVVSACAAGPAPEAVRSSLRDVRDPGVLMHFLALFTNQFFFSKDTISGKDGVTGQPVEPANGAAAYPAPKLEFYRFEPASGGAGFYQTPNGFFDAATRTRDGIHTVSAPTVTGQALALIPAAVEAEVKLIDLFMPRVRVFIDGFEKETGRLRFHAVRIQADKSGAYLADGRLTQLWSSPDAVVLLSVGGVRRTAAVRIETGPGSGLSLDLSREIDAARVEAAAAGKPLETSCVVGLDMGGILVRSEPIKIVLAPPSAPPATALEISGPATVTEGEIVSYTLRIPASLAGRVAKVKWLTSMEAVPKFDEKKMAMMFPIRLTPKPVQADFSAPAEPMTYQGFTNTSFMHKYRPGDSERTPVIGAIAFDSAGEIVGRVNKPVTLLVCPLFVKAFNPDSGWKLEPAGDTGVNFTRTVEGRHPPAGGDDAAVSFAYTVGAAVAEGSVWVQFRFFPDASRPEIPEELCKNKFRYVYNYGQLIPQSFQLELSGWKGKFAEVRTSQLPGPNGWKFSGTNQAGFAVLDNGIVRLQVGYLTQVTGSKVSLNYGSVDDTGWLTATTTALRKEAIDLIKSIQLGK